tara:strand:- start:591 stop:920 length:330 start_codon:yes stop_codon:yes gene_type:complete
MNNKLFDTFVNPSATTSSSEPTTQTQDGKEDQSTPAEILAGTLPPTLSCDEPELPFKEEDDKQHLELFPEDFANDEALEQVLQSLGLDMPEGNFKAIQITWCKAELIEE